MRYKNYIIYVFILFLVIYSNAEFTSNQNQIHNKFSTWTKQAHDQKLLSESILSEYYHPLYSGGVKINLKSNILELQRRNDTFMQKNTCQEYLTFKAILDTSIQQLLVLNEKEQNNLTPYLFANTINGIQDKLDMIIAHFEEEEVDDITSIQNWQLSFNIAIFLVIGYLFYAGIFRTNQELSEENLKKQSTIDDLKSQQSNLGENIYVQTFGIKEHLSNLEQLLPNLENVDQEAQELIDDNLYEIKHALNTLNLYFQSSVQEADVSTNLSKPFHQIADYFNLQENTLIDLPSELRVKCENQDLLLFAKFLFKICKENQKENEALKISIHHEIKEGFVHIYVKDNGKGIRPENLAKLFKLSSTLEYNPEKQAVNAFHFSLLKKIINDYQGDFKVESDGEQGTSYNFTLPIHT
ncbi:Histidine kinase-, DNA gyrase B-, and HSP90-like ATPase [Lishizhenia tianjinensis]|uniref:Histidine kinase-, DNA gyrase B-, and HSP90-like ATPase n=1 Tax=Lishizhenia tianjinensis TaxID=477690 RepID=A0A1I6YMA0_9FLAO|nr:ATP-binding protein [Lishizhenia tianjinensis]SFT51575.1 Histidine kinase-, DNA gyrase B-, and HSP90-like ATPase [Lishizhenia tianjinensis]